MLTTLPHWNALLNVLSITLAWTGYWVIRSNPVEPKIVGHKRVMLLALVIVIAFLTSYFVYHAQKGITPFPGQGGMRTFYYALLVAHALSALATGLLLPAALYQAVQQQREKHKIMARRTLLAWTLASLTGLAVYVMVYHWYPAPAAESSLKLDLDQFASRQDVRHC